MLLEHGGGQQMTSAFSSVLHLRLSYRMVVAWIALASFIILAVESARLSRCWTNHPRSPTSLVSGGTKITTFPCSLPVTASTTASRLLTHWMTGSSLDQIQTDPGGTQASIGDKKMTPDQQPGSLTSASARLSLRVV